MKKIKMSLMMLILFGSFMFACTEEPVPEIIESANQEIIVEGENEIIGMCPPPYALLPCPGSPSGLCCKYNPN